VEGDTASKSDLAVGVLGKVTSTAAGLNSAGVRGINNGRAAFGVGVEGRQYGSGWGVFGTTPSGRGVYGFSATGVGVYGATSAGVAGFFDGPVTVNGDLIAISGHVKAFRIDDPLDPRHKYLVHASIESNEVLNTYSGNITTDQKGTATVRLPAYFDRINTDVRYQLTGYRPVRAGDHCQEGGGQPVRDPHEQAPRRGLLAGHSAQKRCLLARPPLPGHPEQDQGRAPLPPAAALRESGLASATP
jgi:hypothetical protein